MSSLSEIRHHIRAVEDTKKITRAMYLISSAKMKKAMRMHEQNQVYFHRVRADIRFILDNTFHQTRNPYFRQQDGKRAAYLVIAGDKGLCGGYNNEILRFALSAMQGTDHSERSLFTVGQMASRFFLRYGMNPDIHFLHVIQNPSLYNAREVTAELCKLFRDHLLDEVYLVYTSMEGIGKLKPTLLRMLPVLREDFEDAQVLHEQTGGLTYHPSRFEVFDEMVPHYLVGLIYSALVQAYASEHCARMTAMDSAMRNAEEMLDRLSLQLGHARQAAITQELSEIVSGAPETGVL